MSRLHPVFPVVKLMPAPADPIPGRQSDPPPDPILVDGEEHYEVEAVLDSHIFRGRLQYLIQWKGYSYEHNSWENAVVRKTCFHWVSDPTSYEAIPSLFKVGDLFTF